MRMKTLSQALGGILAFSPWLAFAFNSGSTGADGAFSPTVSQEVVLPPSGVFNFTNVNIPAGVTITFKKNVANTPVVILASGDVAIAGTINVSGTASPGAGAGGTGALGDDGMPGIGGPGGYDGGRGGQRGQLNAGGGGLGPGGGGAGTPLWVPSWRENTSIGGGGAGFGAAGTINAWAGYAANTGVGGALYGSSLLLPLIGGSGGGGGCSNPAMAGSGGGGGGGAILVAASGTINITGSLLANGGASGATSGDGYSSSGGGGSGGAIRLTATTVAGNGTISAAGGAAGNTPYNNYNAGGAGAVGRIRVEAETLTRTAQSTPNASLDVPGQLFVAGLPTLTITSVAGVAAPANATGNADITLPVTTANPVTVEFRTTNVPVGNIVMLTVTPAYGATVTALTPALVGDTTSATASAQITLPTGPSTLQAQTTYTIVASLGDALSRYANNERVEKVQLSAVLNGPSTATLITVSGKEFQVPAALLAMMPS